jgi:hypothetical protein
MRFALVLFPLLAWSADWDRRPYERWDRETALRLLTDSPWAQPKTVALTWYERVQRPLRPQDIPGNDQRPGAGGALGPLGSIGVPREKLPGRADVIIRWSSALPLRQATAVYRRIEEKKDESELAALVPKDDSDYVLEIFNVPVEVAHAGKEMVEVLAVRNTRLTLKDKRVLKPVGAKAIITGTTLALRIHFARDAALKAADGEMEATGDLQIFRFQARFNLKSMRFGEGLAL